MRMFVLERLEDVSGISGTGTVAEGVEFSDGRAAVRWLGATSSTELWDNIAAVEAIHGHGGKTVVQWTRPEVVYVEPKNSGIDID